MISSARSGFFLSLFLSILPTCFSTEDFTEINVEAQEATTAAPVDLLQVTLDRPAMAVTVDAAGELDEFADDRISFMQEPLNVQHTIELSADGTVRALPETGVEVVESLTSSPVGLIQVTLDRPMTVSVDANGEANDVDDGVAFMQEDLQLQRAAEVSADGAVHALAGVEVEESLTASPVGLLQVTLDHPVSVKVSADGEASGADDGFAFMQEGVQTHRAVELSAAGQAQPARGQAGVEAEESSIGKPVALLQVTLDRPVATVSVGAAGEINGAAADDEVAFFQEPREGLSVQTAIELDADGSVKSVSS